MLKMTSNSFQT